MHIIVFFSLIATLSLQGGGSMHSIVLLSLYIVPTFSLHGDSMHNIVLLSLCHLCKTNLKQLSFGEPTLCDVEALLPQ
jgi:hypothetical protein